MKLSLLPTFVAILLCFCLPLSALAQHNPSIEDYMSKANELMDDSHLEEAIAYLDFVLNQKEGHEVARFNRAICHYELMNYNSAIFDLNYVIEQDPKDLASVELRAIAYDALGQYDNALADFSKILTHKRTSSTLVNRGFASLKARNYMVAIIDFQDAIQMRPSNSRAYGGLGEVFFTLKRYKEAISNFDIAIQLNPSDAFLYNNRGDAKMKLANADLEGAYYDFHKALELGQEPVFYSNLAHLFLKMEDWDQAKRAAIAAMGIDDNHAEAYYVVSILETEWGIYHQALSSLEIAIGLDPDSPTYYSHMGDTQYALGNYFEAVESYTNAQKIDYDLPGIDGRIAKAFGAFNESMESTLVSKGIPDSAIKPVIIRAIPEKHEIEAEPIIEYEVDNLRMLRVKNYKTIQATPIEETPKSTKIDLIAEDMFGEEF